MPNKIVIAEDNWDEIKEFLPKNWCKEISESLNSKGIAISPQSISDARTGRIKNLLTRQLVWKEIKKVSKRNKMALKSLKHITH
jgi:hypothetical protein